MKLGDIKEKDALVNSFFRTREIFGIPFWKLDIVGAVVFSLGAVIARTLPFRLFCVFMAVWFGVFIFIDRKEYMKLRG